MKLSRKIKKTSEKIKKTQDTNFTLYEVITIVISFCFLTSAITTYVVNYYKNTNMEYKSEVKDIVDTYDKIINNYYQEVDGTGLADSAIDGMMNYLGEEYSIYLDDLKSSTLNEKLKGDYEGIGISIMKNNQDIVINSVYKGTPAQKAGLKAGDIIKSVNDFIVSDDTELSELTEHIKNTSKIKMIIERYNENIEYDVEVKKIQIPVVSSSIIEENNKKIGYIYLSSFTDNANKQVEFALKEIERENIDSLIFDLRDNTGGYLNVCKEIASMFIKKGKTLYLLDNKKTKKKIIDETDEERTYPIIVLINKNTASASEILASSLKESYGAIIVGEKSFGKGRVQQTSTLSDATMIKYTTDKWYTPLGNSIDGIGVIPGINVEQDSKYYEIPVSANDAQLKKAVKLLSNN